MNAVARTSVATFIVALMLPFTPAEADVEVVPDPGRPLLILEGSKIVKPENPEKRRPDAESPVGSDEQERPSVCTSGPTGALRCDPLAPPPPDQADERELTEGDILEAVRTIGLPALPLRVQPGDETLVNIETIFYTQPQPFERSVDLLGFDVDLVATPVAYRWVHGDGTSRTTGRPGKPYPSLDVTHRYLKPADDVRARVDVTYRVRYRVDGAAWQTIARTLTASGPSAGLDVNEAAPVLTRP